MDGPVERFIFDWVVFVDNDKRQIGEEVAHLNREENHRDSAHHCVHFVHFVFVLSTEGTSDAIQPLDLLFPRQITSLSILLADPIVLGIGCILESAV